MKIEVERFTNFNRTKAELQMLLFFSIAVAGKNASITARAVARFFNAKSENRLPYDFVHSLMKLGTFRDHLKAARLGKYTAIEQSAKHILKHNIDGRIATCTLEDLQEIPYLGLKTARMILLHSRPGQRMIPLDTHILKFMRNELGMDKAPKSTPGDKKNPKLYLHWERCFLNWIERCEANDSQAFESNGKLIPFKRTENGQVDLAHVDLNIWLSYRVNTKEKL